MDMSELLLRQLTKIRYIKVNLLSNIKGGILAIKPSAKSFICENMAAPTDCLRKTQKNQHGYQLDTRSIQCPYVDKSVVNPVLHDIPNNQYIPNGFQDASRRQRNESPGA
ncbi:hypothetical protein TI10_10610 [Photorhabdus luminescens subsp. luminescens]|nr:hypothetical protein TI10_10610 [Photorhabdus luminescens subsp. luminescens]